jgi:hypothetical protein
MMTLSMMGRRTPALDKGKIIYGSLLAFLAGKVLDREVTAQEC